MYPLQQPQQLQKLESKLKQASQMYEKQFLNEMVKAMRNSVNHSTPPTFAESIYRGELDDQYVDKWVEKGGVGFADLIYNDLVNKYYPQLKPQPVAKKTSGTPSE